MKYTKQSKQCNLLVIRRNLVAIKYNTDAEQEGTQTLNY